jgi:hypothetical protein
MSKNQVAVQETKEYAVALGTDFEDDANSGFDGMGQEDFALPFLRLLTNTSPEVGESGWCHARHDHATPSPAQLYDGKEGIHVIPVRLCAPVHRVGTTRLRQRRSHL